MRRSSWRRLGRVDPRLTGLALAVVAFASALASTRFSAPPRFDGAGYSVLGRSIAEGSGYREINHPDAPRHGHFPPGYPVALAVAFRAFGPSTGTAHALSLACTTAAVVATWYWLRSLYAPAVASTLGAALAVNWTWGRTGGAIQSEPLYFLLGAVALLVAGGPRDRIGPARAIVMGALLGACILTRHVAACLAAAVLLELLLRRKITAAATAAAIAAACVAPWIYWVVQTGRPSQAALFVPEGLLALVPRQLLFCARRLPDQLVGPVVELATVYARSERLALQATGAAFVASAMMTWGWLRALRVPRRRLAGLVPLLTLALLLVWPFTEAGRFLVPLVPFVLVGTVEGTAPLLFLVGLRRPKRAAALMVLAASLPYALYSAASGRADAQRRTHDSFNAACAWIAHDATREGPVLCRYPADVFWQTGRRALEPGADRPEAIGRLIDGRRVAYLVIEDQPYTNAMPDPLARFVTERPERVRRAWGGRGAVAVYEVIAGGTP